MVTDQEPRYRLVDADGDVVGSLFAETDGTLKLQEGTSGNDNELSLTTQGALETEQISIGNHLTRVGGGTVQSISDSSSTVIEFDQVQTDELTGWDTSTDEFTVPTDGVYRLQATVSLSAVPADTLIILRIRRNGPEIIKGREVTSGTENVTITTQTTRSLSSGDGITVTMFQTSGTSLDTISGSSNTQLVITREA